MPQLKLMLGHFSQVSTVSEFIVGVVICNWRVQFVPDFDFRYLESTETRLLENLTS